MSSVPNKFLLSKEELPVVMFSQLILYSANLDPEEDPDHIVAQILEPNDFNHHMFPDDSSVQISFSYFGDSITADNFSLLLEAPDISFLNSSRRILSLSLKPPLLNLSIHLLISSAASSGDFSAVLW